MTADVIIDDDAFAVIHLQGKAADTMFFRQHFQDIEFEFLEFRVAVRRFTQPDDPGIVIDCQIIDVGGNGFNAGDFPFCLHLRLFDQIDIQHSQAGRQDQHQYEQYFNGLFYDFHFPQPHSAAGSAGTHTS